MKTLYFAPHPIWPESSGGRLRDYQLARQLATRSDVTFAEMRLAGEIRALPPGECKLARVVTLEKERAYTFSKILRGLRGPTPLTVLNCWSPSAARRLASVLRAGEFDTVQIENIHLMNYLPAIRRAPGCPAVVADWHNIESELMWRYAATTRNPIRRAAARRTAKLLERAEDFLLENCGTHTVTSERERKKLLARNPSANIQVIPNGVNTANYSATKIAEACRRSGFPRTKKNALLFVGSMDYHANIDAVVWFSRAAWPQISRAHPELQFSIVGRHPARSVRALASGRIHVSGTVEDVRPFYSSAVAAVVPIRSGGGTRLKILEAMAAGVPVVSTRLGAEGIAAEHGVHLLLADTGPEIAGAVSALATSEEMRFRLSKNARALVCREYDWSVIGERLYTIHENLAVRGRSQFAGRRLAS